MDFEDILEEVGDYGYFQKRLTVLFLVVAATFAPSYIMTTIFMVSSPTHWCKVSQLSNLSFEEQIHLISPLITEEGVTKPDSCNMFDVDYNYLAKVANISTYKSDLNITSELSVKPCDNGWAYDNSYYGESAVTALDLVCDRSYHIQLILSASGIGTIIGTPIFGWLSDKIGRKKTFQLTIFTIIISSLSPTFFRDLTTFIIFRTLSGLIYPSFYQLPFLILLESVGPKARTLVNSVACLSWVGGMCLLSLFAYLTRHWVWFNVTTSATIVVFFLNWKLLPESPRWLITTGRYAEAADLLRKVAKANGKDVPLDLGSKLRRVGKKLSANENVEQVSNAVWAYLKNPGLRKNFIIITVNWMSCAAVYFGIYVNLYNFSGNEFLNFFLLSIIELPAYLLGWYLIETRFGRRWTYSLASILCGLSLCIPAVIPDHLWVVTNVLTLMGKCCGTICFMVVYQQAAEMYPTSIRNQGLGYGSMASSVVSMAMPYLVFAVTHVWIPLFVLGVISLVIGFLSTLLPETLNVILPQTIDEGNIFGRNQKYFSWANTKSISKIEAKEEDKELVSKNIDSYDL